MHESDDFWRENASRLNERDYEQLKLVYFTCRYTIGHSTGFSLGSLSTYWALRIPSYSLSQCTISDSMSNTTNEGRGKSTPPRSASPGQRRISRIITDLGAKARAMELMTHPNPDVRYHALVSVQQLVSHPWIAV